MTDSLVQRQPETFPMGGRAFRAVALITLRQDVHIMGRVREAGLDSLPMLEGESGEDYAGRVLTALLASPHAIELIAAGLIPAELPDEAWSPEVAAEVARVIGAATSAEDKLTARRILLGWLVPFLQSGLARLMVSRRSSGAVVPGAGDPDGSRVSAQTSGSGAPSS